MVDQQLLCCSGFISCPLTESQWVKTQFGGKEATGRILSKTPAETGSSMFEIELPLLTNGRMIRVLRRVHELQLLNQPL